MVYLLGEQRSTMGNPRYPTSGRPVVSEAHQGYLWYTPIWLGTFLLSVWFAAAFFAIYFPYSTQPQLKMGLCTLAQSLLTRMPHLVLSGPGPPVDNGHEWLPYQGTCYGAKSLTGLNWAYTQDQWKY